MRGHTQCWQGGHRGTLRVREFKGTIQHPQSVPQTPPWALTALISCCSSCSPPLGPALIPPMSPWAGGREPRPLQGTRAQLLAVGFLHKGFFFVLRDFFFFSFPGRAALQMPSADAKGPCQQRRMSVAVRGCY